MPGDPSPRASSGGIIAYNGDSARGWNDPPTFAFSNNKTGNKPKLDLRKRVSHQQALHGGQTPSPSVQASVVSKDDIANGVAGLNLNGFTQPLFTPPPPVTTTAPVVSNFLGAPSMPAVFTRSISTPSFTDAATSNTSQAAVNSSQALNSPTVHAKSTDNLSGNLGQPLFDLKNHNFEPVRTAPLHSIRSTAEISDHLDDHHDSHSSPQIFHPITPPLTTATGPLLPQPSIPPLGHVTPPPSLPYQPPVGHITPPLYPVHSQSPTPPAVAANGNGVVNHSPAVHSMTPPPPPGNHVTPPASLSAGSTPRSTSPSGQEKNGDSVNLMDDQEGLKVTMDALQDVVEKLKDTLEKRVADDIARRLQVMSQNWTNGKLSPGVKSRMIKLAKALDDGDVDEAHHMHISLMVDFVAEVVMWNNVQQPCIITWIGWKMISGCSQWYWSKTLFDWVNEIANPLLCYILHRKRRKMADELPDDFDVIVLGTGFTESVIAAALSRVGLKVLHLDRNDYYSGQWVTFTFDSLLKWIECNQAKDVEDTNKKQGVQLESGAHSNEPPSVETGTYPIPVPGQSNEIKNVVVKSYFREKCPEESMQSELVTEAEAPESAISLAEPQKLLDSKEIDESKPCDEKNTLQEVGTLEEFSTEESKPSVDVETAGVSDVKHTNNTLQCVGESENLSNEVTSSKETSKESNEEASATDSDSNNVQEVAFVPAPRQRSAHKPVIDVNMTYDDLKPYWKRFNIDISPKLLFSRGPLVEALISANISHYAEFKALTRILTYIDGRVEEVPCSRADVFSSNAISVVEKRMLMKFLTFCLDFEQQHDQYEGFEDKPYSEFLQSRRLTPSLQHFVIHAIAMVKPETATVQGLKATQSFLQSLGRYGNTPFIWPLYGAGELPQAFCRMCAVFGGLYCLRQGASTITVSEADGKCMGIISENQVLKCKWLITEFSYVPERFKKECTQFVSRAVFITCSSLKASEEDHITILSVPPSSEGGEPVRVIELGPSSMACPKGLYVVHLVSKGLSSAKEDLEPIADKLFHFPSEAGNVSSDKPTILWSLYFNQAIPDSSCISDLPPNVYVTSLPGMSLGFGEALQQAKEVFEKICPDEEFLQPVPNPEDIILDDFLQDANQNATQPGLGAEADAVDPDSGEESPALTTEQEQTEGGNGVGNQPGGEEGPAEQERAGDGCGVSNQPSGEESPVLATEQEQANADGVESSQPSEEDSQSGTAPSVS